MFKSPKLSLCDMLGEEYIIKVCEAAKILNEKDIIAEGNKKVNFYSEKKQKDYDKLLQKVGTKIIEKFENDVEGYPTESFEKATNKNSSFIGGAGCMRIGEDGYMYLLGKSEHYHASLGHNFNGYKLINKARMIGISNATHNNTRGYITRKLESKLIDTVNYDGSRRLCRIINLSTGSLAVEAGVKMMLARFYKHDKNGYDIKDDHKEKIPVFLVMGDLNGGTTANYHGTTIITQTFRNMWEEFYKKAEDNDIYKVIPVNINDSDDFENKIKLYNNDKYKTAGFIHEIILMNYGAIKLKEDYLRKVYDLCREYKTPVMVDEIQTCMWYNGMFLFKKYNIEPDMVVIGKGFSGGEYAASKIITTKEMDILNQFGALVTNGQEELASLAYLITMEFSKTNGKIIEKLGDYFYNSLKITASEYNFIKEIQGMGHCVGIHFYDLEKAKIFTKIFEKYKIDCALHLYKANCPPAILFKPPLISSEAVLDYICDKVKLTLEEMKNIE